MKIDVNFQGVYTNIHFCPALEIIQESTSNQKK